jgi:hypothetical protein
MAICNRDLDPSEQKHVLAANYGAVATTLVLPVGVVPYPSTIVSARVAATGISGAPTGALKINRFIVGSGSTVYLGGFTTLTLQAVGTSGVQSVVIAAAGSTALNLLAGDEITYTSAGANAAVSGLAVSVVIQATQDIRSYYGS